MKVVKNKTKEQLLKEIKILNNQINELTMEIQNRMLAEDKILSQNKFLNNILWFRKKPKFLSKKIWLHNIIKLFKP